MFDDIFSDNAIAGSRETLLAATRNLEANTSEAVKKQRLHVRVNFKASVTARPGNSRDRHTISHTGVSGDVSSSGCMVLFPEPLNVGDIYQLKFDSEHFCILPQFARCMRCRFIREDAFETGFHFFSKIHLPETPVDADDVL